MRARRSWPSRFNWASTSRSRKPASSSPRSTFPRSFNWDSTSRSRKHPEFSPARGCRTWLQLGLDLAVEETRNSSAAGEEWYKMLQLGLDLAVEETWRQHHAFTKAIEQLQLGLDLAVEETWLLRARLHRTKSFNWASTSRSRKPCCRRCWP